MITMEIKAKKSAHKRTKQTAKTSKSSAKNRSSMGEAALVKRAKRKSAPKKRISPPPKPVTVAKHSGVSVGTLVPDFSLPSSSGSEFVLSGLKGKKMVLYFYPKDATPGCTLEGHEFSRLLPEFHQRNVEVFGISRDSIKSHCRFRDKEGYSVELLSDSEELACQIFGVIKEKNMYGKKVLGIERSTFVIDEKGKLIKEWRKVKAEGHAQEVLDSLKG